MWQSDFACSCGSNLKLANSLHSFGFPRLFCCSQSTPFPSGPNLSRPFSPCTPSRCRHLNPSFHNTERPVSDVAPLLHHQNSQGNHWYWNPLDNLGTNLHAHAGPSNMQSAAKISPPITLLQEICSRNGLTPDYQLLSTEGSVHEPTFKIAVSVADISAIASGQSKKKARHAAARDAIEQLRQKKDLNFEGINFETLAPIEEKVVEKSAYSTAINDPNPVGKLQEICMKMRVNPPDYDTCDERGLAHERVFYLSCNIASLDLRTLGQGRSKKLAKRQAAELMLAELESTGVYDKTTNSKSKAEQGQVESLLIDEDDNSHFVRSRCQISDFIKKLDYTERDFWQDLALIEEDENDSFYYILQGQLSSDDEDGGPAAGGDSRAAHRKQLSPIKSASQDVPRYPGVIPDGYHTEFNYLNDFTCLLHIYESCEPEPIHVMTSFGMGVNEVNAMKQAVINCYKIMMTFKNPLVGKKFCDDP